MYEIYELIVGVVIVVLVVAPCVVAWVKTKGGEK